MPNSLATVSASFQVWGAASWTSIAALPARATWVTPMPFCSSAALKVSATRSVWFAIAVAASTPRTRWIPPWRSRPRLIVFFGGYRYQIEPAATTATKAMRNHRRLGIAVGLTLDDPRDGAPIELQLHLVGDAQRHRLQIGRASCRERV